MKMVRVELENCYGIRSLCAELDFSKKNAVAIYAPNGVMKTSLARTFADLSQGELSRDRIFPDRVTKREIKDESGADLLAHDVVVIQPYD
jgi:ABC-type transport system involved in cytochrome c biogenesis ATPase subunit